MSDNQPSMPYKDSELPPSNSKETPASMAADPLASFKNSLHLAVGLAKLPEFGGAPNEDIEKFLKEFATATTALTSEQKCLALRKALTGDAALFLKKYLKPKLLLGEWKEAKAELRKRFSRIEPSLLYRTQLNKMSFNQVETTLLSYVDKYADLYRKIHTKAEDRELIQDLSLNLGKNIIVKLNQLSSDWKAFDSFENFRRLIQRLERDIMSLENDTLAQTTEELAARVNKMVRSALESPIKEIQDILANLSQHAKQASETKQVAAVKHAGYPAYRYDRDKRKNRDWEPDQNRPRPRVEQETEPTLTQRASELRKAYAEKYGEVTGPCYICGGQHFRRHCPLGQTDLKESGNGR